MPTITNLTNVVIVVGNEEFVFPPFGTLPIPENRYIVYQENFLDLQDAGQLKINRYISHYRNTTTFDFKTGVNLICDGNWNILDLSGIIPPTTTWALMECVLFSHTQPEGSKVSFRKLGADILIMGFTSKQVDIGITSLTWLPIVSQSIQYKCSDDAGNGSVSLTIKGWMT